MINRVNLNGDWNFVKDSECKKSYEQVKISAFDGKIKVPSNWQLEGFDNYNGTLWYIKEFDLDLYNTGNEIAILQFSGVDYFAEIYLNDNYLGNHEGYFQTFSFDATRFINFSGKNLLAVKVSSPLEEPDTFWPLKKQLIKGIFNHHDCRPGGWDKQRGQDCNTGGIWNSVELFLSNDIIINYAKILAKPITEHSARVYVELESYNNQKTVTSKEISFNLLLPNGQEQIIKQNFLINSGKNYNSFCFDINDPEFWNPWDLGDQPLYELSCEKFYDGKSRKFAIRTVKLDENSTFYINGKRLFLRGTNIIPTQFLSDLTQEKIQKMVGMIKEANINVVRIHAHVNRQELYDAFDEAGILLWQDFPLQWTYQDTPKFVQNAVSQIRDMVSQLYNHPSIVFWCCHNEPGEQVKTLDPFLKDAVLSVDNSRIVRLASNYEEHPYDGWYWGNKEHFASTPMGPLVTEFGAQGLPAKDSLEKFLNIEDFGKINWADWKYHNFQFDQTFNIAKVEMGNTIEEFVNNSQNYQTSLLETAIDFYRRKKNSGITGIFQFMFIDCWPSITWSIVDYYFKPKSAYYALKTCFEPLYLSVKLRQDSYCTNGFINFDFWIINDLHQEFADLSMIVMLDNKEVAAFEHISTESDSVFFSDYEKNKIELESKYPAGNYLLTFKLLSSGRPVNQHIKQIKIVESH